MKEELSIDIIGLAGAYSYALDCIEAELVNIQCLKYRTVRWAHRNKLGFRPLNSLTQRDGKN